MSRARFGAAALIAAGAVSMISLDVAEARRGGSFGSRGMRTYSAPPATRTSPTQTQPVQRSMTRQPQGAQAARTPTAAPRTQPRTGMFSNPLVRGLLLGGLLGALLGFGFGGLGGGLAMILQIAVVALLAFAAFRFFASRRRAAPATAASGAGQGYASRFEMQQPARPATEPNRYFATDASPALEPAGDPTDEIGITQTDLDAFETLLKRTQSAFGAEDYAGLREVTTPEIMSYLSEELSQNAVQGRRNQVTDISLDQGDLSEAWREGDTEYATVAMRYASRDVMLDRASGQVVEGDPDRTTETTELWTFVRQGGQPWKVSAIQEA